MTDKNTTLEPLLNPVEVGEILGCSSRHVLTLPIMKIRLGPRTVRYQREDVEKYIESKR